MLCREKNSSFNLQKAEVYHCVSSRAQDEVMIRQLVQSMPGELAKRRAHDVLNRQKKYRP
jgi:hypothetical protein